MKVTVLAGGIGGARFLLGLRELGHDVTVIGNNGDDITLYGLRVCPDLDTVMYTLGGGSSVERGWGREAESFRVVEELTHYVAAIGATTIGAGTAEDVPTWFGLGDLDLATHLLRTTWLGNGVALSEVTRRLCERWKLGVRLLPATDDPVETHVTLTDGRTVHFQEWWVRLHADVPATRIEVTGAAAARPAPGVVDAITTADVVLLPPSNPVVSVGAILAIPAVAEAVRRTPAPVVGLSPVIGGAPVRGMADACLAAIGVETGAGPVAQHYGARPAGFLDGWLVDDTDAAAVDELRASGIECRARPLLMTDLAATTAMAQAALDLANDIRA